MAPRRSPNGASRCGRDDVPAVAGFVVRLRGDTSSAAFPKRFAVLFMGNGVNENHWGAEGSGADMKLSQSLSPLEPLKKKINVINGLFNKNSTGQGIHPAQTGSLLTGAPITAGPVVHSGISVDQMIASRIGQDTLQPSIVLACEQPMTGYHETNFSMAYSSHISWQNADSPVPNEVYPALAFDTLFENRGSLRNLSILDRVRDAAQTLSRQISSTDQQKLDEYMTSVREVETRIEGMRKNQEKAEDLAKLKNRPALSMERPANGLPEDFRDHTRLMCDIIALAFQTDKTRVASLLLARDLSALYYPFLDVKDGHHAASHDNLSDGYERIARFHLSQLAYLATQAGRDARGRRHGARQFLPDVPVQPVGRPRAQQLAAAGGARRWSRRHARNRAVARLPGRRRRESQDVQPVPGDHGPDGNHARPVRRRRHAPGRSLVACS